MIAVIDIGSNSVRLMLWAGGTLYKKVETTRLGAGLAQSNRLCEDAMARTAAAICAFAEEARGMDAQIYAFATAAVRSAENGGAFLRRVASDCGVMAELVSGETEARLGVWGAIGNADGAIVDIGGASTELCIQRAGQIEYSVSLPLGAVRLHDACGEDKDKLLTAIRAELRAVRPLPAKTYAIGGTASTLASVKLGLSEYDGAALQDLPLTENWLQEISDRFFSMSAEERKGIRGMDVRRADVIAGSTLLLLEVMRACGRKTVSFSDRDNLEGYLIYRGIV